MKLNIQRETLLKPLQQVTGVVENLGNNVDNVTLLAGLPTGWSVIGGPATYDFKKGSDGDVVVEGTGGSARNAFLVDPKVTGDFLLDDGTTITVPGRHIGRNLLFGDGHVGK